MKWFKNELSCGQTNVIIRSYCRNEEEFSVNSTCTQQMLNLTGPDGKTISRDLLKNERSREYFRTVRTISCVEGNEKKYLYLYFSNGGNCIGCETDEVIDLNGIVKRRGQRWSAPKKEREEIARKEMKWFKQESTLLYNKIRD